MSKRAILLIVSIVTLAGGLIGFFLWPKNNEIVSPIAKEDLTTSPSEEVAKTKYNSIFNNQEIINILLIGIDRRNKIESTFNTDTMILVSANTKTNKLLFISVPRDLWINGNKINALYSVNGAESLLSAFSQITGMEVKSYIRADFEDFRWLIDEIGGIDVDVQTTFTDNEFPNSSDTGITSVTYTQGKERMNGERALTFARTRKGNNGEGSDLKRAARQHLILQGIANSISNPESKFWPMNVEKAYNAITSKMLTTLTLDDAKFLWDFYKDRDKYSVESFIVDDVYIYHPGMYPQTEYRAWVFVPRDPTWSQLHSVIQQKLNGTFVEEASPTNNPTQ